LNEGENDVNVRRTKGASQGLH